MELKKRLSPKVIFVGIYAVAFVAYLIYGLQPAEAAEYEIATDLSVPAIGLTSGVTELKLNNHELDTPDTIVGSFSRAENKTLLIGHSSTALNGLEAIKLKDEIIYNDKVYKVDSIQRLLKEHINMDELLKGSNKDTIVIMTCAGTDLGEGDATHRLIVTAS